MTDLTIPFTHLSDDVFGHPGASSPVLSALSPSSLPPSKAISTFPVPHCLLNTIGFLLALSGLRLNS
jgi:hypothetical protein